MLRESGGKEGKGEKENEGNKITLSEKDLTVNASDSFQVLLFCTAAQCVHQYSIQIPIYLPVTGFGIKPKFSITYHLRDTKRRTAYAKQKK